MKIHIEIDSNGVKIIDCSCAEISCDHQTAIDVIQDVMKFTAEQLQKLSTKPKKQASKK